MAATNHPVLLTGATGFVGAHLYPALRAAGYRVISATRDPDKARSRAPQREWVKLDVDRPETLRRALAGCGAVVYLVHQMGSDRGDYAAREAAAARALREAAAEAGVQRIVYLGGVAPSGKVSQHLQSRLNTGALLREGRVPTIELRAAMVIGKGSSSWQIVRDLAARLPAMVLPRWLNNKSSPVAIDDVVTALLWALDGAPPEAAWFDVPGAETMSHRELIARVAWVLGKHPAMIDVPVVTPALSSYWIALVTRIHLGLARELVQGLQADLVPSGDVLWRRLDRSPLALEVTAHLALADEESDATPGPAALARMVTIGESHARDSAA